MAGHMLAYVQFPVTIFLLTVAGSGCFGVSGDLPSLTIAKFALLQLSPSLVVENSPGSRPGSKVVCERLELNGLARLRNLTSFFSSVKLKVINVNFTGRPPNIAVCFHRNASLGVGMCPEGLWEKLTNGSWVRSMSPFDHKFLDVCSVGPCVGTVEVVLNEEFYLYRVIFLILGITMMTFASSLSNSLATYYGGAMTLGVLLVVLVILFQGMKILPSGRKSSLALVLYGSIVGVGSFLFSYVPTLLHALLLEMGISEDLYSPVAALLLVFVVLCGAWLGFWAVRKLVLTEDGSIDTGVAKFVAWSIRLVASSMILQCSVDPLLAVAALVSGILIPSAAQGLHSYYASKDKTSPLALCHYFLNFVCHNFQKYAECCGASIKDPVNQFLHCQMKILRVMKTDRSCSYQTRTPSTLPSMIHLQENNTPKMNGTGLQKTPPRKHWKVLWGHTISTDGPLRMQIDSRYFPRKTLSRAQRVGFLGLDQLIIVVMKNANRLL